MTPQTAAQILRSHGWRGDLAINTYCNVDTSGSMVSGCAIIGSNDVFTDWRVTGADVGFALLHAIVEVDACNRRVEAQAQRANDELAELIGGRFGDTP